MRVGFNCFSGYASLKSKNSKIENKTPQRSFKAASPEVLCSSVKPEVQRAASYILAREWDSVKLVLNYLRADGQANNVLYKKLLKELIPLIPGADKSVLKKGFSDIKTFLEFQTYVKREEVNYSSENMPLGFLSLNLRRGIPVTCHNFAFKTSHSVGEELKLVLDDSEEVILNRLYDIPLTSEAMNIISPRYLVGELSNLTGTRGFIDLPTGIKLPNEAGKIPEMQQWVSLGTAWKKIIAFLESSSDQVDFANSFHFKQ